MLAPYDKRRNPLFDTKINRTDLKGASSISFSVFVKIEKNEFVSMKSISKNMCCMWITVLETLLTLYR